MADDASLSPASSPSISTSSETERESLKGTEPHNARPQTPQPRRRQSESQNVLSPVTSPILPSPMTMNLYRLGIGSSPLRRQFSSSYSNQSASPVVMREGATDADDELSEEHSRERDPSSSDQGDDDDLTQDSKDVLVDRLNDLLKRLSTGGIIGGDNITTLHAKVDEMEKVLASEVRHKPPRPRTLQQRSSILQLASPLPILRSDSGPKTPEEQHQPDYWGFTRTPPQRPPLAPAFSELSSPEAQSKAMSLTDVQTRQMEGLEKPEIPTKVADSLVAEAEKLCTELNTVMKNLQDRRGESDHIHEMLVIRAEAAAKRIMELDDYVSTLEDEISTNRSDLEHLRLQLRALEVLCYEYVPPDADRDLLESIENWKSDYSRLKLKLAARRRERNPLSAATSPSVSSVLSPSTSVLMERAGLY